MAQEIKEIKLVFNGQEEGQTEEITVAIYYIKAMPTLKDAFEDTRENAEGDAVITMQVKDERSSTETFKYLIKYIDAHDPQLLWDYKPQERVIRPIQMKFEKYNEPKKEITPEQKKWFEDTFGTTGINMKKNKFDDFVQMLEYLGCTLVKRHALIYLAKLIEAEVSENKSIEEIVKGIQRVMGLPETGPINIEPHLEKYKKECEEMKARGEKDDWDKEFDKECEFRYDLKYKYYEAYLKLKTELEIGEYLTEAEWAKPEGYEILHDNYLKFINNENEF